MPDEPLLPKGLCRHYEIFRDYIKHEDDLINQRSMWHLLIQGFLFATLGVLGQWQFPTEAPDKWYIERHWLVIILAVMGMFIALLADISIFAANRAAVSVRNIWQRVREPYGTAWEKLPALAGGGDESAVSGGRLSAMTIPVVVGSAWLVVCGMAIWDYSHPRIHAVPAPPVSKASHQCGEPILGDLSKLSKQELVQEVACSALNTDLLQKQLATHNLELAIKPLGPKQKGSQRLKSWPHW